MAGAPSRTKMQQQRRLERPTPILCSNGVFHRPQKAQVLSLITPDPSPDIGSHWQITGSCNCPPDTNQPRVHTSSLSQDERKLRKRAMLGPHSIVTKYYYYY